MSIPQILAAASANSHIRWAMAALEAGEPDNALEFLRRAQNSILPAFPGLSSGPTDLYVPGIRFSAEIAA